MLIGLNCQIDNCQNFFWHEALYLPQWDVWVWPNTVKTKENIESTAKKMELIRAHLGVPLRVTSWFRPERYNRNVVFGAQYSAHVEGLACDFVPVGMEVKEAKENLKPKLREFGIRMESNLDGNWLHIDLREPGPSGRYFTP